MTTETAEKVALEVGMRVAGGQGDDRDEGRIMELDDGMAFVAWDTLVETWCRVDILEAVEG